VKSGSIGIAAKITSDKALLYAAKTADDLQRRGYEVCYESATAEALGYHGTACFVKTELGGRTELLITFGGDGTLLSLARHAPPGVPVLGVNMGTLGFLTEVRLEEFPAVLESVLAGEFVSEERVTFDVRVSGDGPREKVYRVLNDAVINKSALARIIEMRVEVGGAYVSTFRADGFIVSTPTGSTAYNLSAGGPIVSPLLPVAVITPICPHTLSLRPLVVREDSPIEVTLETQREEVFLTLDGQEGTSLGYQNRVEIRRTNSAVLLVKTAGRSFYEGLRGKLRWGG
jgi:NAD+ kinase